MSREKQIEEMRKDIPSDLEIDGKDIDTICEILVNKNYQKQEWISVEDELPSKDGKYLVCSNADRWNKNNVYQARYHAGHGWGQKDKGKGITHWMPLPTPPKMKGTE